jgi:hypothetical protein
MVEKHERKFRSRFGALVFEDILVFRKGQRTTSEPISNEEALSLARDISIRHLHRVKNGSPTEVLSDLLQAIDNAQSVLPSPLR